MPIEFFRNSTKLTFLYNVGIEAYKNIPAKIELPPAGIEPRTYCVAFNEKNLIEVATKSPYKQSQ